MYNLFFKKDLKSIFFLTSSIFMLVVAAALAQSNEITYNDYYLNTTEGDIYKLSLISDVELSSTYISNCTLAAIINSFRDVVIQKMNDDFCASQTIAKTLKNYSRSNEFLKFDVLAKEQACPSIDKEMVFSGQYAYLAELYKSNDAGTNIDFENCLMLALQVAYDQSETVLSDSGYSGLIPEFLTIPLCLLACFHVCGLHLLYKHTISSKPKLLRDATINKISDQPLLKNSEYNRCYASEDDNDSNDASSARSLIS